MELARGLAVEPEQDDPGGRAVDAVNREHGHAELLVEQTDERDLIAGDRRTMNEQAPGFVDREDPLIPIDDRNLQAPYSSSMLTSMPDTSSWSRLTTSRK
jgi:hypothetical protein